MRDFRRTRNPACATPCVSYPLFPCSGDGDTSSDLFERGLPFRLFALSRP